MAELPKVAAKSGNKQQPNRLIKVAVSNYGAGQHNKKPWTKKKGINIECFNSLVIINCVREPGSTGTQTRQLSNPELL